MRTLVLQTMDFQSIVVDVITPVARIDPTTVAAVEEDFVFKIFAPCYRLVLPQIGCLIMDNQGYTIVYAIHCLLSWQLIYDIVFWSMRCPGEWDLYIQ